MTVTSQSLVDATRDDSDNGSDSSDLDEESSYESGLEVAPNASEEDDTLANSMESYADTYSQDSEQYTGSSSSSSEDDDDNDYNDMESESDGQEQHTVPMQSSPPDELHSRTNNSSSSSGSSESRSRDRSGSRRRSQRAGDVQSNDSSKASRGSSSSESSSSDTSSGEGSADEQQIWTNPPRLPFDSHSTLGDISQSSMASAGASSKRT